MHALAARALGMIGAGAVGIGLANIVAPGSTFPSAMTCVTDSDMIMCATYPWPMAPWLALGGAVIVVIAVTLLRQRRPSPPVPADDTT